MIGARGWDNNCDDKKRNTSIRDGSGAGAELEEGLFALW